VSRNLPAHLSNFLKVINIKYILLGSNNLEDPVDELTHSTWLGGSQAEDAKDTIKALSGQFWDWIVVDHYALDIRWESIVRKTVKKIMVIDDLADRQHECNILLDQNYFKDMQTRYSGKVQESCKLLLGPRYALLRKEFRDLRKQAKVRNGKVKKLLVFFGGVDSNNFTLQAIESLSEINAGFQVDIVIGTQHPFKETIESACVKNNFVCHVQTSCMAELILEADLAIGAGGSSSWERCCLGLPSLVVAISDNQVAIAKGLSLINACVFIGNSKETRSLDLKQYLTQLLVAPELIQKISKSAFSVVDGLGVLRVIDEMKI